MHRAAHNCPSGENVWLKHVNTLIFNITNNVFYYCLLLVPAGYYFPVLAASKNSKKLIHYLVYKTPNKKKNMYMYVCSWENIATPLERNAGSSQGYPQQNVAK